MADTVAKILAFPNAEERRAETAKQNREEHRSEAIVALYDGLGVLIQQLEDLVTEDQVPAILLFGCGRHSVTTVDRSLVVGETILVPCMATPKSIDPTEIMMTSEMLTFQLTADVLHEAVILKEVPKP